MRTRLIASWALAAAAACSLAPAAARADESDRRGLYLDVPVIEAPFNLRAGPTTPSMAQSLALSADFYQLLHYGIGKVVDPFEGGFWQRFGARALIAGADFLSVYVPLGFGWQHEEWHRAVLGSRKISSFDDVYTFPFFKGLINVSRVDDDDLARLKAEHPAEFVRMSTAGIEGNYELATQVEKTQFFYQTRTWNGVLLWALYLENSSYMATCASKRADGLTDDANRDEGSDVRRRDFTGLDCTGWTYDLFRPGEPYAARGTHPSGVGINRYRRNADLSSAEKSYLTTQAYLSALNFLDPQLIGLGAFTIKGEMGAPWRVNAHVRHMPTSFGNVVDLDGFAQHSDINLFVSLHSYFNREHYFPGVTAEVQRFPLDLLIGLPVSASARVGAWLQPRDQAFETAKVSPGGLLGLRLGYGLTREIEPYLEVEAKTAGWSAGSVYLTPNVTGRAGVVAPLL